MTGHARALGGFVAIPLGYAALEEIERQNGQEDQRGDA